MTGHDFAGANLVRIKNDKIGEPEDIALGVLYLSSPAARYVTGKIIEIDGGTESSTLDIPIPDF